MLGSKHMAIYLQNLNQIILLHMEVRGSLINLGLCSIPLWAVFHASEVGFVYGHPPNGTASAVQLSEIMMDYWISFATSLDPNDGHGVSRSFTLSLDTMYETDKIAYRSSMGAIHPTTSGMSLDLLCRALCIISLGIDTT